MKTKALAILLLIATSAIAQVTVTSPTSSFSQMVTTGGAALTDFLADQQTGQGEDDFSVNGFYSAYSNVNGVQTQLMRFNFNSIARKTTFTGNVRVGVDADGDGDVDLFYGVSSSGNTNAIVFQNPGTGLNVSPSTTTLGTAYGSIPLTASNYNYRISDMDLTDGMLTFSMPFATLQSTLNALGFTVDENTLMRFIAFTSTQSNAINQDLYGSSGISGSVRFDAPGGGFTEFENFYGQRRVVPEPSTYGAIFMGALISFFWFRSLMVKKRLYAPLEPPLDVRKVAGSSPAGTTTSYR